VYETTWPGWPGYEDLYEGVAIDYDASTDMVRLGIAFNAGGYYWGDWVDGCIGPGFSYTIYTPFCDVNTVVITL
jgi:hypothetical protein